LCEFLGSGVGMFNPDLVGAAFDERVEELVLE
jgi:hypothetical protein